MGDASNWFRGTAHSGGLILCGPLDLFGASGFGQLGLWARANNTQDGPCACQPAAQCAAGAGGGVQAAQEPSDDLHHPCKKS